MNTGHFALINFFHGSSLFAATTRMGGLRASIRAEVLSVPVCMYWNTNVCIKVRTVNPVSSKDTRRVPTLLSYCLPTFHFSVQPARLQWVGGVVFTVWNGIGSGDSPAA